MPIAQAEDVAEYCLERPPPPPKCEEYRPTLCLASKMDFCRAHRPQRVGKKESKRSELIMCPCLTCIRPDSPLVQTGRWDALSVDIEQTRASPGNGSRAVMQKHSGVQMSGLLRHCSGTYSGPLHSHSWGVRSPETHRSYLPSSQLPPALTQPSSSPLRSRDPIPSLCI